MLKPVVLFIATLGIHSAFSEVERLPQTVVPNLYNLKLKIDTQGSSEYSGSVIIEVKCVKTTRVIVLHAVPSAGLTISNGFNVEVLENFGNKQRVSVRALEYDSLNEFLRINLMTEILPDKDYTIKIFFKGSFTDLAFGIVRLELKGKYFIATNFKRIYARHVFPCFDEPALRAKFRITIERRSEAYSVSNTVLFEKKGSPDNPGWWLDTYYETPLLSPHQVAFVVSDWWFSRATDYDAQLTSPVTFWIQQEFATLAKPGSTLLFANLKLLTDQAKLPNLVPNSLQKVDYIVVPSEYDIRVETLGLIYIRELDFAKDTMRSHQRLMHSMYKGIAKQWFGISLSPAWWNSQWLLDCLAGYVPLFLLSDEYFNEFVFPEITLSVMSWDSKPYAEKINNIPETNGAPLSENSHFTYYKGLMLLRMLHQALGDGRFMQAVVKFARDYASKTVTTDNFWDIIDKYSVREYKVGRIFKSTMKYEIIPSAITTKTVMERWTDQPGYPIISVERTGNDVKVSQKRFYNDKEAEKEDAGTQCWWIPLTYTTADKPNEFKNTEPKQWLGCNKAFPSSIVLKNAVKNNQWIIFNNMISGLYRVRYDMASWNLIIADLRNPRKFSKINPFNRGLLVNDVVTLYYKGDVDADLTFGLLVYLRHETEIFPWLSYFQNFKKLRDTLFRSPLLDSYNDFVRSILTKVYQTVFPNKNEILKFIDENSNPEYTDVKMYIHMLSCNVRVQQCVTHSKQIFQQWQKKGFSMSPIPNDFPTGLVLSIICSSLRAEKDSSKALDYVFSQAQNLQLVQRRLFVKTLSCPIDNAGIKRVLDWCISFDLAENMEDKKEIFTTMLNGRETFLPTVQYFYANFDKIKAFYSIGLSPGEPNPVLGFVRTMACEMNVELLQKLKEFMKTKDTLKTMISDKAIEDCEAKARRVAKWLKDNSASLKEALDKVNGKKS